MTVSETSFAKGLRVLGVLIDNGPLRIEEIAAQVRIPASSVYRYARDLVAAGIIDGNDGVYSPGERLTQLAQVTSWTDRLTRFGLPVLSDLTKQTGETSILTVRVGHQALVVERAESSHAMRLSFERGALRVLYAGASAKVLLAYAPQTVIDQVLADPMPPLAEHTPTRARLRQQLADVRDHDYAISYGEVDSQAVGVAVPVFCGPEFIAGLSVAGPAHRLGQTQARRVLHQAQAAAQTLTTYLEHDAGVRTGTS